MSTIEAVTQEGTPILLRSHEMALHHVRLGTGPDVAPRNIPKRGIPTYLNENIPADHKTTCAKILELEEKLEQERSYKLYLESIASAAHITLEGP